MKWENIIAAIILGASIIAATAVHGHMTRYTSIARGDSRPFVLDRLTGDLRLR